MNRMPKLLVLASMLLATAARAEDMVAVRNAKVPTTSVSKTELRELLTGKTKQWPNGSLVQVVMGGEESPDVQWMASKIFGVGTVALVTKMKQEVFKGELKKPLSCTTDEECLALVKRTEGALAFVSAGTKLPAGVAPLAITP